jgi:ribosome production factor 1
LNFADLFIFHRSLLALIPGSYYYARRNYEIKKICEWAGERGFTNLIILGQGLQLGGNKKFPCSMLLVHLPEGPTLHFRISSVKLPDEIRNHARVTKHKPELILNNFSTRLGLRVSRALAALFPQVPYSCPVQCQLKFQIHIVPHDDQLVLANYA